MRGGKVKNQRCSLTHALLLILTFASSGAAQAPSGDIQVFSGSTPLSRTPMSCSGAQAIRSVTFMKKSAGTRLRITYKDTASAFSNKGGGLFVIGRIDGVAVTKPTGLRMSFGNVPAGTDFCTFSGSFTLVGYADGVAKGSHELSFVYGTESVLGATFTCLRVDEPFLIEIDER